VDTPGSQLITPCERTSLHRVLLRRMKTTRARGTQDKAEGVCAPCSKRPAVALLQHEMAEGTERAGAYNVQPFCPPHERRHETTRLCSDLTRSNESSRTAVLPPSVSQPNLRNAESAPANKHGHDGGAERLGSCGAYPVNHVRAPPRLRSPCRACPVAQRHFTRAVNTGVGHKPPVRLRQTA
jgi:hypothetical protein